MLVAIITTPTTLFSTFVLDLLAIFAAILAQINVKATHSTRERVSGKPPIIKWLIPPVRAVKVMINTLVPTAICIGYPRKDDKTSSSIIPPPAPANPQIKPINMPPIIAFTNLFLGEVLFNCSLVVVTGFNKKRKPIIIKAICIVPFIALSGRRLATKLPMVVTTRTLIRSGRLPLTSRFPLFL